VPIERLQIFQETAGILLIVLSFTVRLTIASFLGYGRMMSETIGSGSSPGRYGNTNQFIRSQ